MKSPLRRYRKIVSGGAEYAGRLFHRLVAVTGKARLPTVVRLKYDTISGSNIDNRSFNRGGRSLRQRLG